MINPQQLTNAIISCLRLIHFRLPMSERVGKRGAEDGIELTSHRPFSSLDPSRHCHHRIFTSVPHQLDSHQAVDTSFAAASVYMAGGDHIQQLPGHGGVLLRDLVWSRGTVFCSRGTVLCMQSGLRIKGMVCLIDIFQDT